MVGQYIELFINALVAVSNRALMAFLVVMVVAVIAGVAIWAF